MDTNPDLVLGAEQGDTRDALPPAEVPMEMEES